MPRHCAIHHRLWPARCNRMVKAKLRSLSAGDLLQPPIEAPEGPYFAYSWHLARLSQGVLTACANVFQPCSCYRVSTGSASEPYLHLRLEVRPFDVSGQWEPDPGVDITQLRKPSAEMADQRTVQPAPPGRLLGNVLNQVPIVNGEFGAQRAQLI